MFLQGQGTELDDGAVAGESTYVDNSPEPVLSHSPERGSGNSPERASRNSPERGSGNSPERGSGNSPECTQANNPKQATALWAYAWESWQRHGHHSLAWRVCDPNMLRWQGGSSILGYADTGGAWVVCGGALGPLLSQQKTLSLFAAAGRAARSPRRVCVFGAPADAPLPLGWSRRAIGQEALYTPQKTLLRLQQRKSFQAQLRRAGHKSVRVGACTSLWDAAWFVDGSAAKVAKAWQKQGRLAPLGFATALPRPPAKGSVLQWPKALAQLQRVLPVYGLAQDAGGEECLVGYAILSPVPKRSGFVLDGWVRDPALAANGSMETLFAAVLAYLVLEGAGWLSFGMAPLLGCGDPTLEFLARCAAPWYNFAGLRSFKERLAPDRWQANYLDYPGSVGWPHAVWDAALAFAPLGLSRFMCQTGRKTLTSIGR